MSHIHLPGCQFYFVPEKFMPLGDFYSSMPQWDDRKAICLDDPQIQDMLLASFLELSKPAKRPLIDEMDRALRWINRFGSPFPLETRIVRYPVAAEACDLSALISISGWLAKLLQFHRLIARRNYRLLSKYSQLENIAEDEDLLDQFCEEVRQYKLFQHKNTDANLSTAWLCYEDFREPRKNIDQDGKEEPLRKGRQQINRSIATTGDGMVQRYTLKEFAKESLKSQQFVAEQKKKAPRLKQKNNYRIPLQQEKFLKKMSERKADYYPRAAVSFPMLGNVPAPMKGYAQNYTIAAMRVSLTDWETEHEEALLKAGENWFQECINGLLRSINPKLFKSEQGYTQRYELNYPWQAMVVSLVRKISTQKPTWRICRACGQDMSYKRSSAQACSEACSKRMRRSKLKAKQ